MYNKSSMKEITILNQFIPREEENLCGDDQ